MPWFVSYLIVMQWIFCLVKNIYIHIIIGELVKMLIFIWAILSRLSNFIRFSLRSLCDVPWTPCTILFKRRLSSGITNFLFRLSKKWMNKSTKNTLLLELVAISSLDKKYVSLTSIFFNKILSSDSIELKINSNESLFWRNSRSIRN